MPLYFDGVRRVVYFGLNHTDQAESIGKVTLFRMKVPCLGVGVGWFDEYLKHYYNITHKHPSVKRFFQKSYAQLVGGLLRPPRKYFDYNFLFGIMPFLVPYLSSGLFSFIAFTIPTGSGSVLIKVASNLT